LLVESVSTPKGPRQKTICSLGDLSPRPASQWLKLAHKIESALVGQCELIEDTAKETRDIIRKVKERLAKDIPGKDTDEVTRGYSRDNRPDCKQALVGLAIGREGFPLAHEVIEGNLQDRKLHYIVASRQPERDEWLSEFEELEGFEEIHRSPSPLNPFQKKSRILIKKIRQREMTYVLCVSEGRTDSPLL